MKGPNMTPVFDRIENGAGKKKLKPETRRPVIEGLTPYENAQEYINGSPEEIKDYAKREAAAHSRFWANLPETHETFIAIKEILGDLSEKAGLPRDFLRLSIFDSSSPDVHVQMLERRVRISKNFLEVVGGNRNKITSVLAHEVGHVLLSHYRDRGDVPDPLDERIQGYEHEYQADRASVILTNRMGIPPNTLASALTDLEQNLHDRNIEDKEIFLDINYRSWVLSTHPHTSRRVMSINRDSANLPRYATSGKQENIPLPKESDFTQIDWRKWCSVAGFELPFTYIYVDCLWEEIEPPESLKEKVASEQREGFPKFNDLRDVVLEKVRQKYEKRPTPPPMDATPEDVIGWSDENREQIDVWWDQAMRVIGDRDGYEDLSDEIREYTPEAIYRLIKRSCPEFGAIEELTNMSGSDDHEIDIDVDTLKYFSKETLLGDPSDYHSSIEVRLVTSLLIRTLFDKDESLKTVEGLRKFCSFLTEFKYDHGTYVASTGARYFIHLENMFNNAKSETEKEQIALICEQHEEDLKGGVDFALPLAQTFMPNFISWMQSKNSKIFLKKNIYVNPDTTTYQLPKEIQGVSHKENIGQVEARELIDKIPKNFRPSNLSALLFSAAERENKRIDSEGYSDMVLEADAGASAVFLGDKEFEEKYFGEGRQSYIKSPYVSLDKSIPEYCDMSKLWDQSGYGEEFEAMSSGVEKLKFLLENFRVRSSRRDILISEALGWSRIEHVEDIMNVQGDILKSDNIAILFEISDVFSNPLLSLSVSQRLWELYEENSTQFFSEIPIHERERIESNLSGLPESFRSPRLKAILIAYKEPTYVRDELLRPLVDAAPDQITTMAIASYYCEPPPGVLRPRSGEVVAVTETLLDTLRGMPQLDKQELFLYFLGHRLFYSGIDSRFFYDLRANEKSFRSDAIFLGEDIFMMKHGLSKLEGEDQEADEDDTNGLGLLYTDESREEEHRQTGDVIDKKYLVESPDSLVFLIKSSGVPVDILLKQQRLTTTRREQRDFITHLLLGTDGVLTKGNKEEFLTAVARNVVHNSSWSMEQTDRERFTTTELLSFALNNCPSNKLPDLFLGIWNLQQEKGSLPQIMTALLRELGSLFIKAGQYLGTQSGALPPEWIKAFRGLSDQNSRAEKTLVYEHEYAVYGEESPFKSIGEKQGEGSMAAVYKGELKKDGAEVVVKISHPNIKEELEEDARFLNDLVKFINSKKSEFKVRLPDNLAEVSKSQILKELSYDSIRDNNKKIAEVLGKSKSDMKWRVPKIIEGVSKPEFIVYEYSPGVPLDKLPSDLQPSVRGEVAMELLRQIFVEGVYQGDPNIGNFKATTPDGPKGKVLVDWLDTDHTGKFTKEETKQLRRLVKELVFSKKSETISDCLTSFVQGSGEASIDNLKPEIENWLKEKNILGESSIENLEAIFTSFLDFLADKKLVLKEEYVTLLRALGLMKPMLADVKQSQYIPFFTKLMLSR